MKGLKIADSYRWWKNNILLFLVSGFAIHQTFGGGGEYDVGDVTQLQIQVNKDLRQNR